MQPYKIDKGVAIPEVAVSTIASEPSRAAITLQMMEVKDSFLVKDELEAIKTGKVVVDYNSRQRKNGSGKAFTTRKIKTGVRVWRVK